MQINRILPLLIVFLSLVAGGIYVGKKRETVVPPKIGDKSLLKAASGPPTPISTAEVKHSQPANVVATSYREALSLSTTEKKNVVVFLWCKSCKACMDMRKDTLDTVDVKNALSKKVFLMVDAESTEGRSLVSKYSVEYLPTYMVLSDDGNLLKSDYGYKDSKTFVSWIRDVPLSTKTVKPVALENPKPKKGYCEHGSDAVPMRATLNGQVVWLYGWLINGEAHYHPKEQPAGYPKPVIQLQSRQSAPQYQYTYRLQNVVPQPQSYYMPQYQLSADASCPSGNCGGAPVSQFQGFGGGFGMRIMGGLSCRSCGG